MATKQQLADALMEKARKEAEELLSHAEGVSKFIVENFPEYIPNEWYENEVRPNDSVGFVSGPMRPSEKTGSLKLQRLKNYMRMGG